MKRFTAFVLLVLLATLSLVSCKKDKDTGKLSFNTPAVYMQAGQTVQVGFTSTDIRSYSITSRPTGWGTECFTVDGAAQQLTIVAPTKFAGDSDASSDVTAERSGSLTLSGTSTTGNKVTATLFISISSPVDMSRMPANSYMVHEGKRNYLFDAMHKGDGKSALQTASVDIVWQSKTNLIQYLSLEDGKVSFYVDADDDDSQKIDSGNAVIGAYDADGTLIWSWHVWSTEYDPDADGATVAFNGMTMMDRNLGALANGNASTDEILASYGLYYQWGRKDPFIGPSTYQASNGSSASMYNARSGTVKIEAVASSAETGTTEYATQHPLTYITGVADSRYDWRWSSDDSLWGETKTVNDPCPYGWKVAPSKAFGGLTIVGTPVAEDYDKYGWTLSSGAAESFFIGAGRRRYDDSKILNIYMNDTRNAAIEAQPWVGLYWGSDAGAEGQSPALYFWFEKKTTQSGIEYAVPYARANGMQVRCVRE